MNSKQLECLFGFHTYSDECTKDRASNTIYLCTICKRSGYYKYSDGFEKWFDYDDKENRIHYKNITGYEEWYAHDDKGNQIYIKYHNGYEKYV